MDKQKQMIEEMANDLEEEFVLCGTLSNCGTKKCSMCYSKYLYEQCYRKIPKDSVVLSREELEEQISSEVLKRTYQEFDSICRMTRKETAEKFAEMAKASKTIKEIAENGYIVSYVELCNEIDEICKEITDKVVQNGN